ncbi:MAG: benzoate/H(+) symporter BenE family transporter [Acetobacteraceae bacterium]|nr:benzoate/H(+) symporter BenE family transporter [Acetobacteraceae bacterium]
MQFSVIASALVAALVGFGGTLAIIVEATRHLGATPDQTSSWVAALCVGMAITSIYLSVRYRMPIVTAWSLAGAVLIASAPAGIGVNDAIGAFVLSAALMALAGIVPALGDAIAHLPGSIAGGMLAGLLLRFALGLFAAAGVAPGLVLPLLLVFLVARRLHPASAPLAVIAASVPLALLEGYALPAPTAGLSTVAWMPPAFSVTALVGLGVPLFLVTMATQQISGAAVLRVSGYVPPVRAALITTGLTTLALAPLGGYSVNLSSITAAICTGPDAHPDPAKRWLTGPVYGFCYLVFALFGASLASWLGALPPVLVATVAGAALLGPLTGALAAALHHENERFASVLAFVVTASGVTLAGVGAAFWGLLAGLLAMALERMMARRRP